MDNQYYPFDIKSKRLLMKIDVNTSLRLGNLFFELHEMEDFKIKAYCRKGLPKILFIEHSANVAKKYFSDKYLSISELILSTEYKKELLKISPITEIAFTKEEADQIVAVCNNGIPDNYEEIDGLDGHSYDIWFENSKRYSLWCWVHESLEPIADVINLLVDRAGLDKDRYGMKVQK